ncbi:MAG: hypothetical protein Q7S33_01100 [Nanoarchaeota archaeon]|nr:hypothetical protein [Nanoarchaeota archaeon]
MKKGLIFLVFFIFILSITFVIGEENNTNPNPSMVVTIPIPSTTTTTTINTPTTTLPATTITTQEQVFEQVKCIFANSKTQQKCYLAGYNDKFFCSGAETCVIDVNGYQGQQLTWKSTCGGYSYTTIDGNNDYAKFDCTPQETTTNPIQTMPPITEIPVKIPQIEEQPKSPYTSTWYKTGYWECYDGINTKQGDLAPGEITSCKPAEVWKKYAEEFCNNHCSNETGKCGVNSFGVSNECSGDTIIKKSVCGNGVCEGGEGEICKVEALACNQGETCKASTGTCYIACPQDCKKSDLKEVSAKLNEKFKLGVSQVALLDYQELKINFNDLFIPKCQETVQSEKATAIIEKYDTITGSVIASNNEKSVPSTSAIEFKCESEPYAVLQLKYLDKDNKSKTDVIKIRLGEKKQISDFVISFLDYNQELKLGFFRVSLVGSETTPPCPLDCICDIYGKVKECKKIAKCESGKSLCPDGVCRDKCNITNITTECKFGCFYQDKCLPYGLRINNLYCSINNDMTSQLEANEVCDNNFECSTNVCIDKKCVSSGLIQKMMDWFSKLFG